MAEQEVTPQVGASGRAVPPNQATRTIPRTLAELLLLVVGVPVLHLALQGVGWGSLAFVAGGVSLYFILPDHTVFGFVALILSNGAASDLGQAWCELRGLQEAPVSAPISVTQAPQFPRTGLFRFADAELRTPLSYIGEVATGRGKQRRRRGIQVVPLVPPGWQPTHPVPAWEISLGRVSELIPAPSRPIRPCHEAARLIETEWPATEARTILQQAEERHHLTTLPDAPLLTCRVAPLAQARSRLQRALVFSGQSIAALWCALLLWLYGRVLWDRRRTA